jgi:anti-sigma factor RsiW
VIKCNDVFSEISNFLDGEMDESVKQELRDHLKKCHKCQVVVDTCQKTIELYCDGKLFPLPDPVRNRLHAALRRECQGQKQ